MAGVIGPNRKLLTLVFVRQKGKLLLGMKKRGFGEGRWNGFGGKVERDETILEGAKRELVEESGLFAKSLEKIGRIDFDFHNDPGILEVHVYSTNSYSGLPIETDEMRPKWFSEDNIPFDDMWPDDKIWFPYMLSGRKFRGYFLFEGMDKILQYSIEEVEAEALDDGYV